MSTWSEARTAIKEFEYPAVSGAAGAPAVVNLQSESEITEEKLARREAYARQLGRQEGEAAARADYESAIGEERATLASALESFRAEQERYFRAVEAEVIQLALAIARKILHREAQLDPLFLRAVVRVTLDKLQEGTQISLRVTPPLAEEWRRFLGNERNLSQRVEILADEALSEVSCVVESSVGTTEIGVEAHLKEIAQGFFDLLAQRPRPE
jgi:flagellar assembly protein FliH